MKYLQNIIMNVWKVEEIPCEWYKAVICPIYKEDVLNYHNDHGISHLPHAYKVFSWIVYKQLLPFAKQNIGK